MTGVYSIKDLEKLSGIKAHTLRIWERRYGIIQPKRTPTNIRYYDDHDLKKVINLAILNKNGFKISKLSTLKDEELRQKALEQARRSEDKDDNIELLVLSMIYVDEVKFEETFRSIVQKFGFEETMTKVVFPFLDQVGILWHVGSINPSQEHFVSNLIRRKLLASIDALPLPEKNARSILMFLPEGELHEIGLLFYYYLARKAGYVVFYLGQSVPCDDLKELSKDHKYDKVITSYINPIRKEQLLSHIHLFQEAFPEAELILSGAQMAERQKELRKIDRVSVMKSAEEFRSHL